MTRVTSDIARSHATRASLGKKESRRRAILEAARQVFSHYGFRATSMRAIANEAELSRTALYQYFRDKEAVFRDMAAALHERSLVAAEAAAQGPGTLEERLFATLDARAGEFYEMLYDSRHGLELVNESGRLTADLISDSRRRYLQILAGLIRQAMEADELDLSPTELTPRSAAEFLFHCAAGLSGGPGSDLSPAQFRRQLRTLVRVFLAGQAVESARRSAGVGGAL